jgi:hypothetical protein
MRWKTALWKVPAYAVAVVFAVMIVASVALSLLIALPWQAKYWLDIRAGTTIIANVEQFRRSHSRLPDETKPDELIALGFELGAGYHPEYRSMGSEYEIEYYQGFDGPRIIYSSRAKQWRCELC